MAMMQGQPPPYSEAQQIITNVVAVPEPNLMALAAAQNTRLPDSVPEEQPVVLTAEHDPNLDCFKQKIYRHALFPLLAMVFEKCEGATSFPDSSTNGFEKDLKACMKCLEGLDKPLMDDDDEINQLMLKAVQVLRIHLMEVEKVNELCKDFCARYISCLKSKLTSESLLHVEGCDSPPPLDCSPSESLSPGMATSPTIQVQTSPVTATAAVTPTATAMVGGGVVLQQPQQQPQIVSGNTVYQMVRTPQGIVAQPIQIQGPLTPLSTTPQQSAIHGSTPLSQVGLAALTSPPAIQQQAQQQQQQTQTQLVQHQQTPQQQISNSHQLTQQQNNATIIAQSADRNLLNVPNTSEEADEEEKNGKQKRGVLPKHATQIMKSWLFQHIVHPYPTEDEKRQIASQTNLTLLQVNNWFINARRRILQPMLEVSNPDKGKAKKTAKPVARPQHRFWPVQSDSTSTQDTSGHLKLQKDGQTDEVISHPSSRTGQVSVASLANGMGSSAMLDAGIGGATSAAIPPEALMNLVQNSGLILKLGPDGQIIPTMSQVAAPQPPAPPNPGGITLEGLQALQASGLLFAPGPSPLSLNLPFSGLAPPTAAVAGAGLAGFGLAGAFPGLAAAAAAASIMNFNPAAAAAAAAYAPLSFANLNATPIDLSSMSSQSAPIQLISGAANAAQINPQLQMHMAGLSYQGMGVDQSSDVPEEGGGQLHIDMDHNSSGVGDIGD